MAGAEKGKNSIEVEGDNGEILLHKLPGVDHDHVAEHKILTETFAKEDRTLHRLADLQKLSLGSNPGHLDYRPNPFNKRNHQYVIGKVLTADPPEGVESPNEIFLENTRRVRAQPTKKYELPETSSQEIGWFTKVQPLCSFRQDARVNHPKRYSELSQYMDTYWSYYPPPKAKFHPKDK